MVLAGVCPTLSSAPQTSLKAVEVLVEDFLVFRGTPATEVVVVL
jgi:hypothetical protein